MRLTFSFHQQFHSRIYRELLRLRARCQKYLHGVVYSGRGTLLDGSLGRVALREKRA